MHTYMLKVTYMYASQYSHKFDLIIEFLNLMLLFS